MNEKILQLIISLHDIQNNGVYTVLYEYQGQMNALHFRIFKGKWRTGKEPILRGDYYLEDTLVPMCSSAAETAYEDLLNEIRSLNDLKQFETI